MKRAMKNVQIKAFQVVAPKPFMSHHLVQLKHHAKAVTLILLSQCSQQSSDERDKRNGAHYEKRGFKHCVMLGPLKVPFPCPTDLRARLNYLTPARVGPKPMRTKVN